MLIEFSVANYRSFKERVTFSMVAAPIRSKDKSLDANNVFAARPKLNLLTSAAIYGANASGKSNLVSAMSFVRRFVLARKLETRRTGGIDVETFRLSTETAGRPCEFEIVFLAEDCQYRYGFRVDSERVHAEWLYHVPSSREALLFERRGEDISVAAAFRKEGKGLSAKTRPNSLFLSVVAQFDGPIAQRITSWFDDTFHVNSGLDDYGLTPSTLDCLQMELYSDAIIELIRRLDTGISSIELDMDFQRYLEETPEEFQRAIESVIKESRDEKVDYTTSGGDRVGLLVVRTGHDRFDAQGMPDGEREFFDLSRHESEGTQKLFRLAGPLLDTLKNGKIIVADEFDARLHPLLTQELIGLFNNRQTNPRHAQLVIATHDTNLLDNRLFRRDQIWFAEKDRTGATDLYSLAEYQGVRNDASYEKDYIRGRYGAIPYLGDLTTLLEGADGEAA